MVRPRLVEEGKPIGWADHDDDHYMNDADALAASPSSHPLPHAPSSSHEAAPASSLLRALGGKLPLSPKSKTQRRGHPAKIVIGGGSEQEGDSSLFPYDRHHHPQPPLNHYNTIEQQAAPIYPPPDNHNAPNQQHTPRSYQSQCQSILQHHTSTYTISHHPPSSDSSWNQAPCDPPSHPVQPGGFTYPESSGLPPVLNPQHQQHPSTRRTHYEIGVDDDRPTERMSGVEIHAVKPPLVVVDGANVAYAYALANQQQATNNFGNSGSNYNKPEPDVRGIRVACDYFLSAGLRVLVVLTDTWLRHSPFKTEQQEILRDLQAQGLIVAAPSRSDDDAYCLVIAMRENARVKTQPSGASHPSSLAAAAYVLSNDMFRDAQAREQREQEQLGGGGVSVSSSLMPSLTEWLNNTRNEASGPGRIAYAFGDMGSHDDYGDAQLDILPNPRHPLIQWIERQRQQQHLLLHRPPPPSAPEAHYHHPPGYN